MHYLRPMQGMIADEEHLVIAGAVGAPGGGIVMAVRFPALTRRGMKGRAR
jgi:hypothetical protein